MAGLDSLSGCAKRSRKGSAWSCRFFIATTVIRWLTFDASSALPCRVTARSPGQFFRLAFSGDAGADEGVESGALQLHPLPLTLPADSIHRHLVAGKRHQVDDPRLCLL